MTRASGPAPGVRKVVVTDLEMLSPSQLRPGRDPDVDPVLVRADRPAPEYSRFLYRAVGGDWYWLDRIDWTLAQWQEWVTTPGYSLWTCWVDGVPAGYVELLAVPRANGEEPAAASGAAGGAAAVGSAVPGGPHGGGAAGGGPGGRPIAVDVEVASFGLLPAFAGMGLGGWLLTRAVERAWEVPGTVRVWLHTCELDSPAALANYRARGFVPCGTSVEWWDTRLPSPGPWRGAR